MHNKSDLQTFIAENPWLLNINYENIPELPNNGLEFQIGSQNRIDLILRDKVNSNPIIVEFKFTPFYRENIGQILEYRARVVNLFKKENSVLFEIFKDFIQCPRLILVVKECDVFFRVACNMSGIELFEYKNFYNEFKDPTKVMQIQDYTAAFKKSILPLSLERGDDLEKMVYGPIKTILSEYDKLSAWKDPRQSTGYYLNQYNNMLINRWIFSDEIVSIGIYEDIFSNGNVCISYFSYNKEELENFSKFYSANSKNEAKFEWNEAWNESVLKVYFESNDFFKNIIPIFKTELEVYLKFSEIRNNGA